MNRARLDVFLREAYSEAFLRADGTWADPSGSTGPQIPEPEPEPEPARLSAGPVLGEEGAVPAGYTRGHLVRMRSEMDRGLK